MSLFVSWITCVFWMQRYKQIYIYNKKGSELLCCEKVKNPKYFFVMLYCWYVRILALNYVRGVIQVSRQHVCFIDGCNFKFVSLRKFVRHFVCYLSFVYFVWVLSFVLTWLCVSLSLCIIMCVCMCIFHDLYHYAHHFECFYLLCKAFIGFHRHIQAHTDIQLIS